nr:DUF3817 domain-containing protein [Nakamurella aerolata]
MPPKTAKALRRYRIAAFAEGVALFILVIAMVMRYVFDQRWATQVWGPIHGVIFAIYVLFSFDLGYKERWSMKGILAVLVAGVIPIVSFVAEAWVSRKVLARQRI